MRRALLVLLSVSGLVSAQAQPRDERQRPRPRRVQAQPVRRQVPAHTRPQAAPRPVQRREVVMPQQRVALPRPAAQPSARPARIQTAAPATRPPASPAPYAAHGLPPRAAPHPIRDPRHFVRDDRPAPAPKQDGQGRPITAQPVRRPPADHAAIVNNPAVSQAVLANQATETQANRYYWHREGGVRYCHYRDGAGIHWYGFYRGSTYYWTRYYAGRWWWQDPVYQRWVYYDNGFWWWQSPAQPQTVYIYADNTYAAYGGPSGGGSAAPLSPAWESNHETLIAPEPQYHSDVDEPLYQAKPDARRFALVVGVESYSGLPKADFAQRDAEAMRSHLEHLGYPVRNTIVLVSSQAARSAVAKYLESWLPQQVKADSRVFVYFSGHGAPDPTTGQAYLMPWDGDPKYLAETGYPLQRLYDKLNALRAREIVVVLDACFSGAGGRSVLVAGTRPLVTKVDTGRGKTGRAVVFTATGADEITGTAPAQGHGLFTYYFLKGLNGAARGTKDGSTVQDVFDYLAPNVEDAARRDNRDQTPQLVVPPEGQRQMLLKDLR